MNQELKAQLFEKFEAQFGCTPVSVAYAPGRVEVLGNHTDYNEGFVLSAAIDRGCFFAAAPSDGSGCHLLACDLLEQATFSANDPQRSDSQGWANYVVGVFSKIVPEPEQGFNAAFCSDVPLAAGLSSSAALEIATGLAIAGLYGVDVPKLELAKIGQWAEHNYAGVKCGLLDQISSLFGVENGLVLSDFRSLAVENVELGPDACFLMCNTKVKHTLVDSAYNERRESCEDAARFFAGVLDHPVKALRDVSWAELERHMSDMDQVSARRAAHVVGENTRVIKGRDLLATGKLEEFGALMFESHDSSVKNFENSCKELDVIVNAAKSIPGALGARLSGGGFGGSAVILVHPRDADVVAQALASDYHKTLGTNCEIKVIRPSAGARLV